jgi:CMP/dCMP kinase
VTEGLRTLVVAIDGPAGSGKSTVAQAVARRLGLRYLDTGALYRALTYRVLAAGVDPADAGAVAELGARLRLEPDTDPAQPAIRVDGVDLSAAVRSPEVTAAVSAVSAIPAVRAQLLDLQRALIGAGGIVVEGRDIGTTVVPQAPVKIFLTANPEARAQRRSLESTSRGGSPSTLTVEAELRRRDELDTTRRASPLTRAPDAVEIDTTGLDVDEVVELIIERAKVAVRSTREAR